MGQANSARERHKSGDVPPSSPGNQGQAFVFDKKPSKLLYQTSNEDDGYDYYGSPKVRFPGSLIRTPHLPRTKSTAGLFLLLGFAQQQEGGDGSAASDGPSEEADTKV